ncbi:MAG: DEAD/DEAH box helicase, partial [Acidimicrobiales bacterium]
MAGSGASRPALSAGGSRVHEASAEPFTGGLPMTQGETSGETSEGSFGSLGVEPRLVSTLAGAGIDRPFPVQALTIPDALAGRDVCGKAKTGSGKTL